MDPNELIAALGTYADPNASDEDKAAALDKLTAHFNSLLDQQAQAEADKVAASEAAEKEAASKASETGDEDKKDEPSKEMASALAQIQTLTARIAKMEKASAVGNAPRAKTVIVPPRVEPVVQKDHMVSMIEAAERNTLRNLSK